MNAQERPTIQQLRNAYDAEMKNILTNKRVLANILVGCTDEFAHCDVEDVIAMELQHYTHLRQHKRRRRHIDRRTRR